jgi:hypothetical protein
LCSQKLYENDGKHYQIEGQLYEIEGQVFKGTIYGHLNSFLGIFWVFLGFF